MSNRIFNYISNLQNIELDKGISFYVPKTISEKRLFNLIDAKINRIRYYPYNFSRTAVYTHFFVRFKVEYQKDIAKISG